MIEKLQDLVINESLKLEKLELFLSQPNYLEILGVSHRELQHSNFLEWMMNSRASHGSGSYFLKSFLNELPFPPEDKIRINLSSLEGTEIRREGDGIDLLIVNDKLKFTISIENKINAGKSGSNQLLKYYEIVESRWSNKEHKNYYVYLTPYPRTLTDEEAENYFNLTYQSILAILKDTIESKPPSEETAPLINNYINNLEKNIMGTSKEAKLAQEIYKEHKDAIDFIVRNKPSLQSATLFGLINDFFKEHDHYENLTPKFDKIIRILPSRVVPYFNHKTSSWVGTESTFALEIFCDPEKIWMKFCFGAINVDDEKKEVRLQAIKDKVFDTMRGFSSISKEVKKRSKSSSNYPSIADYIILKLNDLDSLGDDYVLAGFKKKFQKLEENILGKWADEVEEKLTKPNS